MFMMFWKQSGSVICYRIMIDDFETKKSPPTFKASKYKGIGNDTHPVE